MYRRLTDLHLKLDSRTDSAAAWVEASRAYTKAGNSTGAFDASVILQWHIREQGVSEHKSAEYVVGRRNLDRKRESDFDVCTCRSTLMPRVLTK